MTFTLTLFELIVMGCLVFFVGFVQGIRCEMTMRLPEDKS